MPSPARILAVIAGLVCAACGGEATPVPATQEPTAEAPGVAAPATGAAADPVPDPTALDPGRLLSAEGIGPARRGMTYGDLRAALGPGQNLNAPIPFMADLNGQPLVEGNDTLLLVLTERGPAPRDADPLRMVATRHPRFRTAEGVGPGMTLGEAAARYGAPTLTRAPSGAGEFVAFRRGPSDQIAFMVAPPADSVGSVGVYEGAGDVRSTAAYDPTARIRTVLVTLEEVAP